MVQLKYKFMAENMFRFYRGTCHLFYEDLVTANAMPKSPLSWISGDLHLENFGSYKGDNRLVYFDLNDFDEAVLAPASWELARITTSIFLAFETLGIDKKKAVKMAQLFLKNYSATIARGKAYYIEPQVSKGIVGAFLDATSKRGQKRLLKKRTMKKEDGIAFIADDPRHLEVEKFRRRELILHFTQWLTYGAEGPYNYEVKDVVFRVAGTGSVGLKRYAFLLKSINKTGAKYMIVEMKQAVKSSLAPYVTVPQPEWETEAHRIVSIQQRMQNVAPALLSTTTFDGDDYMIQEMQPVKDSINFNLIKDRYRDIYQVVDDMAMLTASSQLRSSGRQGAVNADALIAFGQDSGWQGAILDYAEAYAAKVKKDYAKFSEEFKKGKYAGH